MKTSSGNIQIKSNGLLGIAALMLDYNNIEVMCLQLITLRIVSVVNTVVEPFPYLTLSENGTLQPNIQPKSDPPLQQRPILTCLLVMP